MRDVAGDAKVILQPCPSTGVFLVFILLCAQFILAITLGLYLMGGAPQSVCIWYHVKRLWGCGVSHGMPELLLSTIEISQPPVFDVVTLNGMGSVLTSEGEVINYLCTLSTLLARRTFYSVHS